jgi:hypothetical protein
MHVSTTIQTSFGRHGGLPQGGGNDAREVKKSDSGRRNAVQAQVLIDFHPPEFGLEQVR